MARTKQTARKSNVDGLRTSEKKKETVKRAATDMLGELEAPPPKKPCPSQVTYLVTELGETHEDYKANTIRVDVEGRAEFEALLLESRSLDEQHQRAITSCILELLAAGELVEQEPDDPDVNEIYSRWVALATRYHLHCTAYKGSRNYNMLPLLRDIKAVLCICSWY